MNKQISNCMLNNALVWIDLIPAEKTSVITEL